ncbi:MAG TPA: efflux transporter outer membrane subunit [Burkholderiaceae bacterium]|jgi:NodT family efflux transporter outer membrane factor (OMF) lipoprotein|nr:efflux transporter outer membrane subunit [Burkholderiaceae bacterium]
MRSALSPLAGLPVALLLAACAVGPDYVRPAMQLPVGYKEDPNWKPAQPSDDKMPSAWWKVFDDGQLDTFALEVATANQDVRVAEANYRQADALARQAFDTLFPVVNLNASSVRSQGSSGSTASRSARPTTFNSITLSTSWELDLWGGLRRSLEQAQASAQASASDLAATTLSLQGQLVSDYLSLRVADEQRRLLEDAVQDYEKSLQLTESRYRAGVAARSDVSQAQAQLEATRAQAIDVRISRAQLEHAIAILIGKAPADVSIDSQPYKLQFPEVPAQLPATLLERRPDVAAAERRAAAANAQIGVATAAFFPTVSLDVTGGFSAPSHASLFSTPARVWSLGPTLAQKLFDSGARFAARDQAVAGWDAASATYRKTVLTALQSVEDSLASLRILAQEAVVEAAAVKAAQESLALTISQYKGGTVSYLNVITAQTTELTSRQNALTIDGRRAAATVQLIQALGGGWEAPAAR